MASKSLKEYQDGKFGGQNFLAVLGVGGRGGKEITLSENLCPGRSAKK